MFPFLCVVSHFSFCLFSHIFSHFFISSILSNFFNFLFCRHSILKTVPTTCFWTYHALVPAAPLITMYDGMNQSCHDSDADATVCRRRDWYSAASVFTRAQLISGNTVKGNEHPQSGSGGNGRGLWRVVETHGVPRVQSRSDDCEAGVSDTFGARAVSETAGELSGCPEFPSVPWW